MQKVNILGFHKGEVVEINVYAKNRDQTTLVEPENNTLIMTVGTSTSAVPLVQFSAPPQVVLFNIPTSMWMIQLQPTDLTLITEGTTFNYGIWTQHTNGNRILQNTGVFSLKPSVEPTPL